MKLHILSDLHLDFKAMEVADLDLTDDSVVVFAGDLAQQTHAVPFVNAVASMCRQVIWVMGNHEYYGGGLTSTVDAIDRKVRSNVYVTGREVFDIDHVRFICATLWTDFGNGNLAELYMAKRFMSDYTYIRGISPELIYTRFQEDARFIETALETARNQRKIVVTHHAPSALSINERFKGAQGNAFFYSDLDDIMLGDYAPEFWIHGHMHDTVDYTIGKTRVIANPRGYCSNYATDPENPLFNPKFFIEV